MTVTKNELVNLICKKVFILDGAMGTELQKRGMPLGVCPEEWCSEHPDVVIDIQRQYIEAGSDAVYTATLGGNSIKLSEYGLGNKTYEINKKLAEISKKAVGSKGFVGGDISTTGKYIEPFGNMSFETAVEVYKEQVKALLDGGVDFFIIETMMDIQEARAALLAVKESCDLPAFVTMTFNEDGRTLTGTDPVTALITLQNLGADAVGCNCSTGPEAMVEIIRQMKPYSKVPLIAKPNAGLPKLVNNKTVFDMSPETFGSFVKPLIEAGVNIIGGCCGTSWEYIKQIKENVSGLTPLLPASCQGSILSSARKTVKIGPSKPITIVGERINPTGKKVLQQELKDGKTAEIRRLALEQVEKGASVLDVNVGMGGIDEKEAMIKAVNTLSVAVDVPLCFDSSNIDVLEAAMRIYPGRALINSISLEKHKIEKLLPLAHKYGAMFIALPLDDNGIPSSFEQKADNLEKIFREAQKYGYLKEDIVADGLVMTVSSNQSAAMDTLRFIEWCSNEFGCNTILGLSNISFGLPERSLINTAFFAMAAGNGLTMAIANPSNEMLMNIKYACEVLTGSDANSLRYIHRFSAADSKHDNQSSNNTGTGNNEDTHNIGGKIYDAVLNGDKDNITALVTAALDSGIGAQSIVDDFLIPAINRVGDLFEERKYFLPQLLMSAEAMKTAFGYLEPILRSNTSEDIKNKVKVILATVKGDIHDIGKNIVGLMLKNHGFDVIDLGKDVSAEEIIEAAKSTGAAIVGLSALMTTTMIEMKEVIALARKEGLTCKFMVGGAAVTEEYAKLIGADGYASDANNAVKVAKALANIQSEV